MAPNWQNWGKVCFSNTFAFVHSAHMPAAVRDTARAGTEPAPPTPALPRGTGTAQGGPVGPAASPGVLSPVSSGPETRLPDAGRVLTGLRAPWERGFWGKAAHHSRCTGGARTADRAGK